jgi:hypothetical protein
MPLAGANNYNLGGSGKPCKQGKSSFTFTHGPFAVSLFDTHMRYKPYTRMTDTKRRSYLRVKRTAKGGKKHLTCDWVVAMGNTVNTGGKKCTGDGLLMLHNGCSFVKSNTRVGL